MISTKRYLAFLLALVMLLGSVMFTLSGCTPGQGGDNSSENTNETEPAETDPAETGDLALIVNGKPQFRVIRHADLDNQDSSVQAAIKVRKELNALIPDAELKIADDWIKPGKSYDDSTIEVLVGMTSYPQTAEVSSTLKYGDYEVRMVGKKIVLLGYTDAAIVSAANLFIRTCTEKATQDGENGSVNLTLTAEDVALTGTKNTVISKMPVYDGGAFSAYYDPGDNCDELIIDNATAENYAAYLQKLEAEGYTRYTSHEITDNKFATYYNDKYTLNVGFYAYYKQARVIIEPYSATTLIGLEADNKFTPVTTSQITMVGLAYKGGDGSWTNNGLSILIRLTDGRFMVVDGGFNRAKDANMLIDLMKEQSKDYASKTGGIKVAAWMITHAHGDHSGMIGKQYSMFKNAGITVERFIVNFMSDAERNKSIASSSVGGNWSSGEGGGYANVYTAADYLKADVIVAHVGQVFYFADVKMEILYTIESYGPKITNAFNTTSVINKMTFTDPVTKKQTVYMSTGDATGPAFQICNYMYGTYLKADIVQVAHHGYTTWGTSDGTIAAYIKMAPPTLLWPQGSNAFPNYRTKNYNVVLFDNSNPNWKETYVAGEEGHNVTLPLPYTVGTANVEPTEKK